MGSPRKKVVDATVALTSVGSTAILAANNQRKFATVGGSQTVGIWLSFGGTAVVGTGTYLPAGAGYQIDDDNLYLGAISGILASGAGQNIGTTEMS